MVTMIKKLFKLIFILFKDIFRPFPLIVLYALLRAVVYNNKDYRWWWYDVDDDFLVQQR